MDIDLLYRSIIEALRYFPMVEAVPYFFLFHLPSAIKIVRRKSSDDVSLLSWLSLAFIEFVYIFYGYLIVKSWQFTFSCLLSFIGALLVIIAVIFYRKKSTHASLEVEAS